MFEPDYQTILYRHVSATLPDSISGQKELLKALKFVLTRNHPARIHVVSQLKMLATYEKFQAELPLKFQSASPADKKHFGKDGGK